MRQRNSRQAGSSRQLAIASGIWCVQAPNSSRSSSQRGLCSALQQCCLLCSQKQQSNQPTNTKQQKHWLEKASQPFTFSGLSDDHFHFYYYLLLLLLVGQRTNKGQRAATTESMREVQKKAKASQSQSLLGPCLQHHQRSVAYLALVVAAATVAVAADAPSLL